MNTGTGSDRPSLVERTKAIILQPSEEWNRIAREETPTRDIMAGYVVPLALIGPLSGFIGGQLFGYSPHSLWLAALVAVVTFFFSIFVLLALVLITDFLSPKFGGDTSYYQCLKLVAYSSTPAWIAGIFSIVPSLGVFGLLGLYSFYLFYVGTAPMLNVPRNKATAFTVAVFVCAILLNLVIAFLSTANVQLLSGMGIISNSDLAPMHSPSNVE